MLDDEVWRVLAELAAPEALAAIQESADALDDPQASIHNINAFFMVRLLLLFVCARVCMGACACVWVLVRELWGVSESAPPAAVAPATNC
jgi:hypothetical protein